jgi:hypothetical protein
MQKTTEGVLGHPGFTVIQGHRTCLRHPGIPPGKWMELETIILCEVSQVQKVKGHMFSLTCGI